MNARLKFSFVFTSTLLTLMLVIGALLGKGKDTEGAYRPLQVYTEVLAHIKSDYVEEPDMKKVTRGALQGLVEYLDPLSSYLTADQYEETRRRSIERRRWERALHGPHPAQAKALLYTGARGTARLAG